MKVKDIHQIIDDEPILGQSLLRLTRWLADYYLCGWGQVLNSVVPAGIRKGAGTRSVVFIEAVPKADWPQPCPALSSKQSEVLEILGRASEPIELRRLAPLANCGPGPIMALEKKNLVRRLVRRVNSTFSSLGWDDHTEPAVHLNDDQLRAWAPIEETLRQGGHRSFLLHGVTGSGKTEIYLRAIEEVIQQGKEAIVLVPEISLTPQTIQRFHGRCGPVAVLHSNLGAADRGTQWRRIAAGQAHVVVGARSAVFAPTTRLGLIVIDEEHENSFKQDSTPRYHARDVALTRARLENVPLILGSATPSLESWHMARQGQITLLTLPKRVLDRPLPPVVLIDERHEPPARGRFRAVGPTLERAMHDTLRGGGQVILLLNRRGFSTHIQCPACGHVEHCKFCDLSMTFHRQRNILLCHYCGYEQPPPERCRQCQRPNVRYQGLGTEKLQAEIEDKFPGMIVRRMDSDTMRRPGSHRHVLDAFREGLIHILLGTQMIAKGLDFPNVTLVGVVNADIGLLFPDFRAAERTFQLVSQVAGRTGRGPRGGKVLVQTFNPEHPSIALAASHDYAGFVTQELAVRQLHQYPPFTHMVRLIVRSKDQAAGAVFAETLSAKVNLALGTMAGDEAVHEAIKVLGPAEAPVFKLKGYFRFHFQLHAKSAQALNRLFRAVLPGIRQTPGVEFTVDVDPWNML
jgi:primosomal protein N' (replication factor Y)